MVERSINRLTITGDKDIHLRSGLLVRCSSCLHRFYLEFPVGTPPVTREILESFLNESYTQCPGDRPPFLFPQHPIMETVEIYPGELEKYMRPEVTYKKRRPRNN